MENNKQRHREERKCSLFSYCFVFSIYTFSASPSLPFFFIYFFKIIIISSWKRQWQIIIYYCVRTIYRLTFVQMCGCGFIIFFALLYNSFCFAVVLLHYVLIELYVMSMTFFYFFHVSAAIS